MAFRVADGNAIEQIIELTAGYGIGGATSTALEPLLQSLRNRLFAADPSVPVDPQTLALLVRMGLVDLGAAQAEAAHSGFNPDNLSRYIAAASAVPGPPELLELVRRGRLGRDALPGALAQAGIDPRYAAAYTDLLQAHLSPAEAAVARQQGFIVPAEQHRRAALFGLDDTDAELQFEIAGLPPGAAEAQDLANRNLIDRATFDKIIAEGHTKTKYTDVLWQARQPRLTPAGIVNAAIREWISPERMVELLGEYGYDAAQADILYSSAGRPPGPGQLQTAFNRGLLDRARFDKGIAESDVRPEWADILFGLRRRYPTLFQLRTLVGSGAITPERALEILGFEGYEPKDAQSMVAEWQSGTGTKTHGDTKAEIETLYEARYLDRERALAELKTLGETDETATHALELADARRIRRFMETYIGRVHSAYVGHRITRDLAVTELDGLGMPSTARDDLLGVWDVERELNKLELTPGEIVQLVRHAVVTPDVGHTLLVQRGADELTAWLKIGAHLGQIPDTPIAATITTVPSL